MTLPNKAIKALAAGFGLASESVTAYKARKHQEKDQDPEDSYTEQIQMAEAQHEQEWALDEAQDELAHHEDLPTDVVATDDIDQMAESFIRDHPPPCSLAVTPNQTKLPYPVVIPQRRPKSRKRGFIKAYAPVLQDFGIGQVMFLDRLESPNKVCHGRPWLNAINLAAFATMALPEPISIAVSIAIQKITEPALEVDGRQRQRADVPATGPVLHGDDLQPGVIGSLCLLGPQPTITKSVDQGESSKMLEKLRHRFKGSHGTTHAEIPYQEVAPLIFPWIDELAEQRGDTQSKTKRMDFVADYMDRRSQMNFMMENHNSALSKSPKPTFTSRYADPSHPANSGSLIALVTGGHITEDHLPQFLGRGSPGGRGRGGLLGAGGRGRGGLVGTVLAGYLEALPEYLLGVGEALPVKGHLEIYTGDHLEEVPLMAPTSC